MQIIKNKMSRTNHYYCERMKLIGLLVASWLVTLGLQAQRVKVNGMLYFIDKFEHTAETCEAPYGEVYTGDIVIPEKITYEGADYLVTEIGSYTFSKSTITSLTLPNTITQIGMFAFSKCTTLHELVLPNSVSECFCAFNEFLGLRDLTLPAGVTNADLSYCASLETLRVNAAVPDPYIKFNLYTVSKLKVYVPKGLKEVYANAKSRGFDAIGWQDLNPDNIIEGPETVAWYKIDYRVYNGGYLLMNDTKLSVTNESPYEEGTYLLKKDDKLEATFVPDKGFVKWFYNIHPNYDYTEKDIISPNSNETVVLDVDKNLFVSAQFMAENEYYEKSAIGGLNYKIFTFSQTAEVTMSAIDYELMPSFVGYNDSIVQIPEHLSYQGKDYSVTTIGVYAFTDSKPGRLIIPTTVTNIDSWAFHRFCSQTLEIPSSVTSIADYCFTQCTLDSLLLPESMAKLNLTTLPFMYNDMGTLTAPDATVRYIRLPKDMTEIADKMFMSVDLSKGIDIPETMTSIGASAFERSNLRSIHLPEGLTDIGSRAFAVCWSLKSITIPASVRKINRSLFADTPLDTLYMMSPTPPEADVPLFQDSDSDKDPWADLPVLAVPKGSKELYRNDPVWSNFDRIIEFDTSTDINSLRQTASGIEGYYNLNGQRLPMPRKGIIIVRSADGKVQKRIVR